MRRAVGLIIVGAIAILAAIALWDERREVLLNWRGYADSGEALGVRVGEPFSSAEARLLRLPGLRANGLLTGDLCIMRVFEPDVTLHSYSDRSWRHGALCLAERDGQIVEVVWDYGFIFTTFP